MTEKAWKFVHDNAEGAKWTPGLREIFDYRDLGIKGGTNGDYVAHVIKANGKEQKDEVQQWHVHDCDFQFVYVLNGWAKFEYEGQGVHTIKKGDTILQTPASSIARLPAPRTSRSWRSSRRRTSKRGSSTHRPTSRRLRNNVKAQPDVAPAVPAKRHVA